MFASCHEQGTKDAKTKKEWEETNTSKDGMGGMRIRTIKVRPLLYLGFMTQAEHVKMGTVCLVAFVHLRAIPILMATTRLRCRGCNSTFTRHGLAQHVSKTRRPLCHSTVNEVLQPPTIIQTFPNVGHPLASDTNPIFSDSSENAQWSSCEVVGMDEGNYMLPRASSLTNVYISDDILSDYNDGNESNDIVLDTADAADGLDADAFEDLTNGVTAASMAVPEGVLPIELAPSIQPLPDLLIQAEDANFEANSEPVSNLTITRFPFGHPGAPIPDADQGSESATYQSSQAALDSSVWAPFCSNLDWEIARWAKTRGPTSSALTELLAIPGVCGLRLCIWHRSTIYLHAV